MVVAVPVFSLTVKLALTFKEPDVPEMVLESDADPAKADMLSAMQRTTARTTDRILFVMFMCIFLLINTIFSVSPLTTVTVACVPYEQKHG